MSARTPGKNAAMALSPPVAGPVAAEVATWACCAYLSLVFLGFMALWHGPITNSGNELSRDRAMFFAVNAATLTGFQGNITPNDFRPLGQAVILALMLGGSVLSLIFGGLAVVRILRLPWSASQVVWSALSSCAAAAGVGGALLMIGGEAPFAAFAQAASAFGNAGLYIGHLPGVENWQTHVVLLPLAVLGSVGLPVLMEVWGLCFARRPLSFHSRTVLAMTAGLYLVALAGFAYLQWPAGEGQGNGAEWREMQAAVASSSVAAVNSRTAGFPFQFANAFPRTMQWLLVLFMAIGASPGGTGGGLKTTTVVELGRGIWRAMTGRTSGRGFGIAAIWTGAYALVAGGCFLVMLAVQQDLHADRLLFETVSAVSNVGLSYDTVLIVREGLYTLSAAMLLGRLCPLLILWWMAASTGDADLAVA